MAGPILHLRLLGSFAATAGETDLTGVLSQPKRLALVAWLVLNRPAGLHRRETICAFLWPESSEHHARGTLRQLLLVLRQELGEGLFLADGDLIGLNPHAVSSDAVAVLNALERADDTAALALYTGDLLPGFHLGEGESFERWFEEQRNELRRGVARAAWRLMDRAEGTGDLTEARRLADRAIALDPENESGLRRALTRHAKAGDRAGALHLYESFARRLRTDWDTEPDPQTRELIERIRNGKLNGTSQAAPEASTDTGAEHVPEQPAVQVSAEVTPQPARARRFRGAGLLGVMAVVGTAVALAFRGPRIDPLLVPGRVLVAPFENHTGDPSLAAIGMVAADWVIQGLQRSGLAEVVDAGTAYLTTHDLPTSAPVSITDLRQLARGTRAGLVVVGAVGKVGDSVEYSARVADARTGRVLRVLDPIRASIDDPAPALDELRSRIAGAIATEVDSPIAPLARGDRPPRIEAYQEFVAGLLPFTKGDYREAIPRFRAAWALDSSFSQAAMWLVYAFANAGYSDSADAIQATLLQHPNLLTPLVRAEIHAFADGANLDHPTSTETAEVGWEKYIAARRRAAKLSPASENDWKLAGALSDAGRHREAAEILQALDLERNWLTRWVRYWETLVDVLHLAGDLDGALAAAERARVLYPEMPPRTFFILAAKGDLPRIRALADSALNEPGMVAVYFHPAAEMEAHGHQGDAIRLLEWGEPRLRASANRVGSRQSRSDHAATLALLATYRNDKAMAAIARRALEPFLDLKLEPIGGDQAGTIARIFGYITAVCVEGDSARIAQLPAPIPAPWTSAELAQVAVCQGNHDEAIQHLSRSGHYTHMHILPGLRPLRNDSRYQAWLHPEG